MPDYAKTALIVVVLALVVLLLAGCVERMFFYPDRVNYGKPGDLGLKYEDVFFAADDGTRLHGWWLPAAQPRATVIHLHGNAGNISNHLPLVAWLPPQGFNVLMFDYRGYGRSLGAPTLARLVRDARAALAFARTRADPQRLVVLGQSLGGATALRLLAHDGAGVQLAIIDSAFASYRGIARDAALSTVVLAPLLPLALSSLPGASDDPITAVARIKAPLLFVHGTGDSVIPIAHSEKLHAAARDRSQFIRIDGAEHLEPLQRRDVQQRVVAHIAAALRD